MCFFARPAEVVAPELIACLLVNPPGIPLGTAAAEKKPLPQHLSML